MTTNTGATPNMTIEDIKARAIEHKDLILQTEYRGYTILFSRASGDSFICDTRTREQVDVTGLGVDGAKLYIDQWIDTAM